VPAGTLDFWTGRLADRGIDFGMPFERFGETVLPLNDPDGLALELVVTPETGSADPWRQGPVDARRAIRGIRGVTLLEEGYERTAMLLEETLGFRLAGSEGTRYRFVLEDANASIVDLVCAPDRPSGRLGTGTVHHVAFRAPSDADQARWRETLVRQDFNVTPIIDRQYFHSIYFREPGGVLFEIATDPPGFAVDESQDRLGSGLMLPPWLEDRRAWVEDRLPRLQLPGQA
jgi:glyoxalase family protein